MITTGGEGKVPPRKRIRGKIGNPSSAPELKSHNLLVNGVDTNVTFYNRRNVFGVYNGTSTGIWFPIAGQWPQEGSGSHQRIGNKIRVKMLRIKGLVGYSPYLITQVRYRIVLYRTRHIPEYNFETFIAPLYSALSVYTGADTVATRQNSTTYNYYCSYFNNDVMKENEIKRRVLFRGMIKPQPDAPNFKLAAHNLPGEFASSANPVQISYTTDGKVWGSIYTIQQGGLGQETSYFNTDSTHPTLGVNNVAAASTTSIQHIPMGFAVPEQVYSGEFQKHYTYAQGEVGSAADPVNNRGFFPIDLTVAMNDNIDCSKYDYVFVIEADWAIGQDPQGVFAADEAHSNFFIKFVPHIYYTDD